MQKVLKSKLQKAMLGAGSLAMALLFGVTGAAAGRSALADSVVSSDGKYYSTYDSLEEAQEAAASFNEQVTAEGDILLKNKNNALPLAGSEQNVSVFGVGQIAVYGSGTTSQFGGSSGGQALADVLEQEGFRVNPRLWGAYKSLSGTTAGNETPALDKIEGNRFYEQSYAEYSDAAIILISRTSGEGSDVSRKTSELYAPDNAEEFDAEKDYAVGDAVKKDGVVYKFVKEHKAGAWNQSDVEKTYLQEPHEALSEDNEGNKYKHALMLTDSEESLVQYVESCGFKKIIFVVNSSNAVELGEIQDDENIDAVLWIGRPGANGLISLPRILNGKVNPSGRMVDLFFRDFSKDPTWQNFGDNSQTGGSYVYSGSTGDMPDEFDASKDYAVGDTVAYTTQSGWGGSSTKYYKFVKEHKAGAWNQGDVEEYTPDGQTLRINGVEYEEDIYLGYRYAETAAKDGSENFDYERDVVYPFGYGLSYSEFTYDSIDVYAFDGGIKTSVDQIEGLEDKLASGMEGDELNVAEIKTLYADVVVTNRGDMAGKHAVQIYVTAPFDTVNSPVQKSHVALVGYAKSGELQPGESETVTVEFNVQDMASYDATGVANEGKTGYVLEAGEWSISALSDSHAWAEGYGTKAVKTFELDADTYVNLDDYTDNLITNLFSKENGIFYTLRDNSVTSTPSVNSADTQSMILMQRGSFAKTYPAAPTKEELVLSADFIEDYYYWNNYLLDGDATGSSAAVYAEAEKLGSDGYYVTDPDQPWLEDVNAFMKTERYKTITQRDPAKNPTQTISLSEVAGLDPNDDATIIEGGRFDGMTPQAAWDEFLNDLTWDQLVEAVTVQAYDSSYKKGNGNQSADGVVGMGPMAGQDSPLNLGSTYQFMDSPTLAATFNKELADMKGRIIGDLGILRGYNRWWGPCVNLHRSPFTGRNSEYHSSDPILTANTAAMEARGAQSKGLVCTPKHAVLNEQESSRSNLYTFVSEQAFREIYARPLQSVVQEGEAMGAMGAMNRIGTVHNYASYNFITGLLRNEWGMKGSYTTDIGGGHGTANPELMIRAGLNDVNNGKNWMSATEQSAWDPALREGKGGVKVAIGTDYERESFAQYYFMRQSATWVFYMHANSAMADNNYDLSAWQSETLNATQGQSVNFSVALPASVNASNASYTIVSLPEGLTFNESTGIVSGKPVQAGTFTIQVNAVLDGWVTADNSYTVTIASAFTFDAYDVTADEDLTVTGGKVSVEAGNEVDIAINSDIIKPSSNTTLSYAVAQGALPEGLTLGSDGSVTGTASAGGTYSVTIEVTATTTTSSGWWGGTTVTTETYPVELTIEVNGDDEPAVTGKTIVSIEKTKTEGLVDTYTITYDDDTTYVFTVTNGEQGPAGVDGEDGDTPEITISEDGFWVIDGEKTNVSAIGEKGEQGEQGPAGPAGAPGESGCGGFIGIGGTATAACALLIAAGVGLIKKRK